MLEYWMANNGSTHNSSESALREVLDDPSSAILFAGYPPWLLYFAAGCCVLFMLIGIPGNLITVAALFRTKKLRNATAVFIMNLSVSDLLFCCFNLPLATSTFWQSSWSHGPLLCRLFPLLRYGLVAVSLFTVLAITINRYVMIGHPRLYPKIYKPRYLVLMVLATWISGFGALVATWFERWGRFGLDPVIGSCSILPDVNGRSPKEFLFILAFLAPCIAIIVCYARIFYIVRKTALRSRRRERVTTDLVKASIEIKFTKNFDDSAIGSSCGPTLTTTENGGSPSKSRAKNNLNSSAACNATYNHRNNESVSRDEIQAIQAAVRKLSSVESFKSEERPEDGYSEETRSLNEMENSDENTESERNECSLSQIIEYAKIAVLPTVGNLSTVGKLPIVGNAFVESAGNSRNEIFELTDHAEEEVRSNFERSVEFLPFIETCAEKRPPSEIEVHSVRDNFKNVATSRSIPNLRFFAADPNNLELAERIENDEDTDLGERRLKVPTTQFTRSSGNKTIAHIESHKSRVLSSSFRQILDTQSLEEGTNGGLLATGLPIDTDENTDGLLSPRSIRQCQYNSEISGEYGSSRSESPSERRQSARKIGVFRRESRFRSARNRDHETGKMTAKDKKLLKMILVIFSSFLICYLPITITKTFKDLIDWCGLNIAGYILIYLTTCINPVIYVVMSSEYRSAYKNVLLCRSEFAPSKSVGHLPTDGHGSTKKRFRERKKDSIR